jgi:hypothetical protein
MVDRIVTLGHPLFQVPIADLVPAVPAHRPQHDLALEKATPGIRHGPARSRIQAIPPRPSQLRNGAPPERIALWGLSFAAEIGIVVAVCDRRVRPLVAQVPFVSG